MRRIAVIAVFVMWAGSGAIASREVPQSVVRAVFLFNFARFTDWPVSAGDGRLTLCVLGDAEVASALDNLIGDRPINNRNVSVARLATLQIVRSCHLLYIPGDDKARIAGALDAVSALPVLTVGDGEAFVRKGGVAAFVAEGQKTWFAINPDALSRVGLRVSSRALGLARLIREDAR